MTRKAGNTASFADWNPFWAHLISKLEYHTPMDRKPPFVSRFKGLTGFRFHLTASISIIRGSLVAMRKQHTDESLALVSLRIMKHLERVGGRLCIDGLKNLADLDGPVVFISNHMASLETYLLPGIVLPFTDITFVLKESLTTKPGIGPLLRAMDSIAVGRADPRSDLKTVLREGPESIRSGKSVVVFPQATRNPVFVRSGFNSLGVKLAKRAGAKVVPIALKTDMAANGRLIKDFGPVDVEKPIHIEFGPAMEITGSGKSQQAEVVAFITSRLESWGGEVAD